MSSFDRLYVLRVFEKSGWWRWQIRHCKTNTLIGRSIKPFKTMKKAEANFRLIQRIDV